MASVEQTVGIYASPFEWDSLVQVFEYGGDRYQYAAARRVIARIKADQRQRSNSSGER